MDCGCAVVHLYCGFSLRRQMAPQQSAKFRIAFFGQFRTSLRKVSVANSASIWTLFSLLVRGLDVLCNALNILQFRWQVTPQDLQICSGNFQKRKKSARSCAQYFEQLLFTLQSGAEGGPVCNHMSPNFDSRSVQGTHRRLKKTWADIPDVGQKGVIQDGVQDGRRALIPNVTPSGSVLE